MRFSAAREIGQAATLMYAVCTSSLTHIHCGNYVVANAQLDEVVALADEKGSLYWKALGTLNQGCPFALTGRASDAIQMLTSGLTAYRSTGATLYIPLWLSYLTRAYTELDQFDDAWRCIGEAMTAMQSTKENWCEAEVNRVAGEIALQVSGARCAKAEDYFERALSVARQQQAKVLGTPRRNEPRTPLARPGQAAASARTAGSGLRLVHRGVRHARSEGGEGVAGGVGVMRTPRGLHDP